MESPSYLSLNKIQKKAFNHIKSMNYGMFLIDSPAGTGKTYLIKTFYDLYNHNTLDVKNDKNYYYRSVQIICPTHKAVSLIPSYMRAMTIHRFLKGEMEYNAKGEQVYKFSTENINDYIEYIFIDECSMINNNMFNELKKLSSRFKIVFFGDKCQLPPVNEEKSMIFEEIDETINLKKNMRSQDSPYNTIVKKFRKNIINNKINKNINYTDYIEMLRDFKDQDDRENCILLAYTNKKVFYHNNKIRRYIFKEKGDELKKFYISETLIFNGFRKTNEDITYYSSDPVKIFDLKEEIKFINYYKCKCVIDKVGCDNCKIKERDELGKDIKFYVIIDQHNTEWLQPYDEKNRKELLEIFCHYKKSIENSTEDINEKWKKYYKKQSYLNSELNYSYCFTVHKSQGSQWKRVYVDFNDMNVYYINNELKKRLQYTAVSRMSNTVKFL